MTDRITHWLGRLEASLADVTGFWMKHSIDKVHGGYFNCLDRDGSVYDTKKHVWLQGRQVWTLARLYNEDPAHKTPEILAAARAGAEFLRKHTYDAASQRVYFCVAEDGKPIKLQRKLFAEAFYVMAMSELSRALADVDKASSKEYFEEACREFEVILRFAGDLTLVGQSPLPGQQPARQLAIPMILLNVICELRTASGDAGMYKEMAEQFVRDIRLHVHSDKRMVLEIVTPDGKAIDTPEGRVLNCGHAIEAGWFLLDYARRFAEGAERESIVSMGLDMIDWSLETGWDSEFGGIYYFLDADGHSPEQLEWPMKLWWVHNEAMVGTLLAYHITKDKRWWDKFEMVAQWTMARFPDTPENNIKVHDAPARGSRKGPAPETQRPGGAWFGYLDRRGDVSQRFKGGPYKGFFHVPRALFLCCKLLRAELADKK